MKIKLPGYIKVLLKLAVTAAALWYVFSRIDLHAILDLARNLNYLWVVAALLLFVLSKLLSAYRLNAYLAATGIRLPDRKNVELYLLGMYYNLFLPGGIGGDGYKIYLLNKHYEVKTKRIFWAVMMDRVIGVLALFGLAVVFFCLLPGMPGWTKLSSALIPLSIVVAALVFRKFFPYLLPVFTKTNLQSLGVQVLQLLSAFALLLALGHKDELGAYLLIFLLSSIVAVLPLTIGGIGSREFTFMLGAQWLGLDADLSIALSLLFYLLTLFTSFWGIIYSVGKGVGLGEGADPDREGSL